METGYTYSFGTVEYSGTSRWARETRWALYRLRMEEERLWDRQKADKLKERQRETERERERERQRRTERKTGRE